MVTSEKNQDYEQVVEKIVFDEEELEKLKVAIREFSRGKIDAKHLKQLLLQCRGRIVNDFSQFLTFCIDRIKNEEITLENDKIAKKEQYNQDVVQLQKDLIKKNEFLKVIANKVNNIVENLNKSN